MFPAMPSSSSIPFSRQGLRLHLASRASAGPAARPPKGILGDRMSPHRAIAGTPAAADRAARFPAPTAFRQILRSHRRSRKSRVSRGTARGMQEGAEGRDRPQPQRPSAGRALPPPFHTPVSAASAVRARATTSRPSGETGRRVRRAPARRHRTAVQRHRAADSVDCSPAGRRRTADGHARPSDEVAKLLGLGSGSCQRGCGAATSDAIAGSAAAHPCNGGTFFSPDPLYQPGGILRLR